MHGRSLPFFCSIFLYMGGGKRLVFALDEVSVVAIVVVVVVEAVAVTVVMGVKEVEGDQLIFGFLLPSSLGWG